MGKCKTDLWLAAAVSYPARLLSHACNPFSAEMLAFANAPGCIIALYDLCEQANNPPLEVAKDILQLTRHYHSSSSVSAFCDAHIVFVACVVWCENTRPGRVGGQSQREWRQYNRGCLEFAPWSNHHMSCCIGKIALCNVLVKTHVNYRPGLHQLVALHRARWQQPRYFSRKAWTMRWF